MNIPNIPTDNLYKFMSLSGLLGTFLCIMLPWYYSHVKYGESRTKGVMAQNLILQADVIFKKYSAYGVDLKSAKTNGLSADAYIPEKPLSKDFINLYSSILDDLQELKKLQIEYDKFSELVMYETRVEWPRITLSCIIGRWIFGIMTIVGFMLWYVKVQRYQDLVLKNSANQSSEPTLKTPADSVDV